MVRVSLVRDALTPGHFLAANPAVGQKIRLATWSAGRSTPSTASASDDAYSVVGPSLDARAWQRLEDMGHLVLLSAIRSFPVFFVPV